MMNKERPLPTSLWTIVTRFLIIFFPLVILVSSITLFIYSTETRNSRILFETSENYIISLLMKVVTSDFESVASDLLFLSEMNTLQTMLAEDTSEHRKMVAEDFLTYAARKELYDQIRFLDETGMEIVRVNFNNGDPSIVLEQELQYKGKRYYFEDTFQLEQGEVFISPFDLNIEHGKIEQPLKPMIRFGTPIFDVTGKKRGIVLLNYLGVKIIHDLERSYINSPGQLMLLNRSGFWFKGPDPEYEWGFMYKEKKDRRFGKVYPDAWQRISKIESGQFYDAHGLFTFTTVFPLFKYQKSSTGSGKAFEASAAQLTEKEYYWKIVSYVPIDVLNAISQEILIRFLLLNIILIPLLVVGSWLLARAQIKRKVAEVQLVAAHNELREKNEQLSELNASKDKFFSIISHDLRNAFNALLGFAHLLSANIEQYRLDEIKHKVDKIRTSAERLYALLENLLTWSRIQRGAIKYSPENVDFHEVVEENVALFLSQANQKQITLQNSVDAETYVYADSNMVHTVLRNLFSNALKFTSSGGLVDISARQHETHVEIAVSDTGTGISEKHLSELFRIDVQYKHTGTAGERGTGLGLNLCKDLVEKNGGRIWVESKVGRGTTFRFTLPNSVQ